MKSHYPDFDVLDEQDEWDEHTRSVVLNRLHNATRRLVFFDSTEAATLAAIFTELLDEQRQEILSFVISHLDNKLYQGLGEGERAEGTPPEEELIRSGLRALDAAAIVLYGHPIVQLTHEVRKALLQELQAGIIDANMKWSASLQTALFKKLAVNAVKAYYSHPTCWSEIGYAGPAYPRGYVRSEIGLTDPWEAKRSAPKDASQDS